MKQKHRQQDETSEKVILGRIAGVYGVKGWVKVFSYTDPMEAIVDYKPWYIRPSDIKADSHSPKASLGADNQAPWTTVTLVAGKRHAKTVVAKLENCDDRDTALAYVGNEIAIDVQQLEQLADKNAFYWRDLIGLTVINQQSVTLGVVKNLMETGANDVLVVVFQLDSASQVASQVASQANETRRERLIPWTMGIAIIDVDLVQGIITVDWDADF